MDNYFSYFRVSSQNQSENGVSLEAQQEANLNYAKQNGIKVVKEFREVQSAAKSNRKQFAIMLKEISGSKNIKGIIFHDVDRSARSLKDWAIIGELADHGYDIRFSRDGSGLDNRGSRLTADIKAVVASDFIRNLSDETKKGIRKRLEQGWCVTGHGRLGYTSKGKGVMEPNEQAPLITECFELYATGKYSLKDLEKIMYDKGLRSKYGKIVTWNKIPHILKCKFYIGLMEVKGQIYNGNHKSIVSVTTFNKVQELLKRRYPYKPKKREYKFQFLLSCGICGSRLKAMTAKKKYQYYYCRNESCPMNKTIKEEVVERWIIDELKKIKISDDQISFMMNKIAEMKKVKEITIQNRKQTLNLQIGNIRAKLNKLTELLLEEAIDKETFQENNQQLIIKLKQTEEELAFSDNDESTNKKEELTKLLANPVYAYKKANNQNKNKLINSMMKDIRVFRDKIEFKWVSEPNVYL